MNLTQRQLQQFVVTAAELNLSRASERLHLSQPALSRALQVLEAQLGVRLFQRSTRQVSLSLDGERFLPRAQRLLAEMHDAVTQLRSRDAAVRGSATLAVGEAFGGSVMPSALKRLRETHPGLRVRLIDDNSRGITQRVVQGEVDIGIGTIIGSGRGLLARPLLRAPIGLLAHPAHHRLPARPSLARAARLPLVKEAEDTSILHLLRAQAANWANAMDGGIEVDRLTMQLSLARSGVGVVMVSALGASHPEAAGLHFVPLSPRVERELVLMHAREREPGPAARALVQAIMDALAEVALHRLVMRVA